MKQLEKGCNLKLIIFFLSLVFLLNPILYAQSMYKNSLRVSLKTKSFKERFKILYNKEIIVEKSKFNTVTVDTVKSLGQDVTLWEAEKEFLKQTSYKNPADYTAFLNIAEKMHSMARQMNFYRIEHRYFNPNNILVNLITGNFQIIDYKSASIEKSTKDMLPPEVIGNSGIYGGEFHNIDFIDKNLNGLRFYFSDLEGAKFINKTLGVMLFRGCNMRNVDLEGATIGHRTVFQNVDLRDVKNIDKAKFVEPVGLFQVLVSTETAEILKEKVNAIFLPVQVDGEKLWLAANTQGFNAMEQLGIYIPEDIKAKFAIFRDLKPGMPDTSLKFRLKIPESKYQYWL
ncbi:pentapeptide repeat-containing protein [Candidatus Omnitrophota bacterium]